MHAGICVVGSSNVRRGVQLAKLPSLPLTGVGWGWPPPTCSLALVITWLVPMVQFRYVRCVALRCLALRCVAVRCGDGTEPALLTDFPLHDNEAEASSWGTCRSRVMEHTVQYSNDEYCITHCPNTTSSILR